MAGPTSWAVASTRRDAAPRGATIGARKADADGALDDAIGHTRRTVEARLAQPGLPSEHRWELQQFARFLSGIAPHPDARPATDDADAPTVAVAETIDDGPMPLGRVCQRPLDAWRCVRV